MYVASFCSQCSSVFSDVCCKLLFPMFHLFFQTYVASVFIWMLHMFHTYVTSVLSGCCICLQWFLSIFRCFCNYFRLMFQVLHLFRCMLQVLHLNILKIDRVLHILQCNLHVVAAGGVRGRAGRRHRVGSGRRKHRVGSGEHRCCAESVGVQAREQGARLDVRAVAMLFRISLQKH